MGLSRAGPERTGRLLGLAMVTGSWIGFEELAFGGKTPGQAEVCLGIHTTDFYLLSSYICGLDCLQGP